MATINLVLDSRYRNKENKSPLIFRMVHNTVPTSFSSGVFIKEEEYKCTGRETSDSAFKSKGKVAKRRIVFLIDRISCSLKLIKDTFCKIICC